MIALPSKKPHIIVPTAMGTVDPFADMFSPYRLNYHGSVQFNSHAVLFLEGGSDIGSSLYGEPTAPFCGMADVGRDIKEKLLFTNAVKLGIPIVGICRGAQLVCALNGGTVVQDVTGHTNYHNVTTHDDEGFLVSSTHHQMMNPFNLEKDNYKMLAWCVPHRSEHYWDGWKRELKLPVEPEIIWFPKTKSLAIQGHPEYMKAKINNKFVQYCRKLVEELVLPNVPN